VSLCIIQSIKLKGKGHPQQATKTLDASRWSTLGRFAPGNMQYPLYRRLVGPQVRSERVQNISFPSEFDLRAVQPVASRYTD